MNQPRTSTRASPGCLCSRPPPSPLWSRADAASTRWGLRMDAAVVVVIVDAHARLPGPPERLGSACSRSSHLSARGTCTRPIDSHGAQGCVPVTSTLCTPPPARSAPQHRRSHLSPGRDPRVDVGGRTGSIIQRIRNVTVPAHRHITVPCPRALATPGTAWSTFNPWRQPLGAPWVVGCTYTYGLTHDDRAATHTHQPATRPPAWQWEDPAEGVQADPQRLSSSSGLKPSLLHTSRWQCERVDR